VLYSLKNLTRVQYQNSIGTIKDPPTLKFAQESLAWWDRHFSWQPQGCIVLCGDGETHLCYVFYKIDRYGDYLTIHNLFTPLSQRRCGYAATLLRLVFAQAASQNVSRFRLSCVSKSLDFYLALGFVFWGLNSQRDYYCDMPMPQNGLENMDATCQETKKLLGKNRVQIRQKIEKNHMLLNEEERSLYAKDIAKLGSSYRLEELLLGSC